MRTDDLVVEAEALARTFHGPPPVTALLPCSFIIRRGEYVAITGASGSGKTTLLSLLGLLDVPTAGRYLLDGVDVAGLSDKHRSAVRAMRIGFVFQAFHLIGYRSVLDNVELGLLYQGVSKRRRHDRAVELIERVGLGHRKHAICSRLSGGEKQRVATARALIREPSLVLCDEPTGNLDSGTTAHVLELLDELHDAGLTIVIVTHNPAIASRAQRTFVMSDGELAQPSQSRAGT